MHPQRGDKYRNALGHEAELTIALVPGEGQFDYSFKGGAFIRIDGMVVAHVEGWPDIDNHNDHLDSFEFPDEEEAGELADRLLKTLGFTPNVERVVA